MPHADVLQRACCFLGPHCCGEAEVGRADHAEAGTHAPIEHRLDHDVRDAPGRLFFDRYGDIDAVVAHVHVEGGRAVLEGWRRLAVQRVIVVAVPEAAQPALLDRALIERPAVVRALVIERAVLAVVVRDRHRLPSHAHCHDAALGRFVQVQDALPLESLPCRRAFDRHRCLPHPALPLVRRVPRRCDPRLRCLS